MWRALLAGFVTVDVIQWSGLRKPDRFGFKSRLAVDTIDVAIWSLAPYPPPGRYDLAVFIAAPLAIEAGLRRRAAGFVVPAVILPVAGTVRMVSDRPVMPLTFLWLVMAVVCGVVLSGYGRRLRQQAETEWSERRSAGCRQAYLAGENSVAMGASSVVDGIEAVLPILGRPPPGSALYNIADGWKTRLAQATSDQATYLGQALQEWAADHNRHPDLFSRVELSLAEGDGTTILTGMQAKTLNQCLDKLDPRGSVIVQLGDRERSELLPGAAVRLFVGHAAIDIPSDPRRPPRPYDPGPAAFILIGLLMLADIVGLLVPVAAALAVSSMFLGAAIVGHVLIIRYGDRSHGAMLVITAAVGIIYCAVITLTMHQPVSPAGVEGYPVIPGLDLLAILGALYWRTGGRLGRVAVLVGAPAVLVMAWLLHPLAMRPQDLALTIVWPLGAFLSALRFEVALKDAVEGHRRDVQAEAVSAEMAAFRDGRATVIKLVRQARDDANHQLCDIRRMLLPQMYENVRRRLEEVDRRLDNLTVRGDESCSSTTTS